MCIRDSVEHHRDQAERDADGRADAGARPDDRGHDGEEDVCLLYTSDAADERSSVDLGGRRIIKKKKAHT